MSAFLLIRHAQSTWNASGRWQGQADPPLSPEGEELACQAGEHLSGEASFDLVITSDLERARRTGEILSGCRAPVAVDGEADADSAGAPGSSGGSATSGRIVIVEPALREFNVGEWSGLTRAEIDQKWPFQLALFDAGHLPAAPGGETRSDFDNRIRRAAARVAQLIRQHGAQRTLVVTHGGVIRSLVRSSGLPERHVPNLAGYGGVASSDGMSLHYAVDLLHCSTPDGSARPGGTSQGAAGPNLL